MSALYIVVSLWIEAGRVADFEAYERKAAHIMKRYRGHIERAIRPAEHVAGTDMPFEIHLLRFPNQTLFDAYRADEALKGLAAERAAVITKTTILIGTAGPSYAD